MSATSYAPVCPPAKNTAEMPLALGIKLGFIKDNRFLFDYEHSKIIYDRCLDHISTCQLSARCLRVFNTILRQTVGFSKREDHATTTRLEQLTKIRHDHIGNTLNYLSKRNIIKWRKGGKYNNYLSINYDFASWGERNPAKQNPNNDPTILLPDYYIKTPIDQGISFDDEPEDLENPVYVEPVVAETQTSMDAAQIEAMTALEQRFKQEKASMEAEYLDKDSMIQVVSDIVDDKFSQIKQLFKQNTQPNPVEPQVDTESDTTEALKNSQQLEQQESEIEAYQREITALKQQSQQEITELKQQSQQEITELKQQSEEIVLENRRLHEKQIETHIQNQPPEHSIRQDYLLNNSPISQNFESFESMDYPVQLSKDECISAKTVVMKSPQKAQDILDLLAIRLNQTQPVLNNPIAYLARLVQKEQSNELDFSALQTFTRPQVIQRDLQDLIQAHNRDYGMYIAYGEMTKSYDFQPDDPDNYAELKEIEDQYSDSFDRAQASYDSLKAYIADYQLDSAILTGLDSNASASASNPIKSE